MKKNKKKGFTLIELLAVIVILAIIALIATPIILNVIDTAKNGAAESSALGYIDAVEKQVMLNQVSGTDLITPSVYDKATLTTKKVEVKGGSDITDLKVRVDEKGQVTEGKFCINGKSIYYNGKKAEYKKEEDYCNGNIELEGAIAKKYTIVNDANSNGTADVGDEIALGDEHFYVISNDGTNINALAKYNLNVGPNAVSGTTGIQNSAATGCFLAATGCFSGGSGPFPGAVAFSDNNGWPYANNDDINIQDYEGPVKTAINNYKAVVTNASDVRLITKTELEGLGCDSSNHTCSGAPAWVYSTSYWAGSARSGIDDYVWDVRSVGAFGSYYFINDNIYGVRPVITLES